jgi:hypothetical protein
MCVGHLGQELLETSNVAIKKRKIMRNIYEGSGFRGQGSGLMVHGTKFIFPIVVFAIIIFVGGIFAGESKDTVVKQKTHDEQLKEMMAELPDNIKDLSAMEADLMVKSRAASDELFKVLTNMRTEKAKVVKSDPEIKALNAEITKLRTKIAELTLKKSKKMGTMAEKRELLVKKHDDLRQKIIAVKVKKTSLLQKEVKQSTADSSQSTVEKE